jgi:predicted small lipoprotein YifL
MKNVFQIISAALLMAALAACQTGVPGTPQAQETQAQDQTIPAPLQAQASPICGNAAGTVFVLTPAQIAVAQRPGRQLIGLISGTNGLLILVDDAPGLPYSSVDVELDLDPTFGASHKTLEFWSACRGSLVNQIDAFPLGGFGVGVACLPVVPATNFRSDCTLPGKTRIFRNSPWGRGITEFWFRKPNWFGAMYDAFVIDASFWSAFGGRSVRFIWRFD